MRLEWSARHSVNVKEIDEQHQHFIDMINGMIDALENDKVREVVDRTLHELIEYAVYHFATEEKLMEQAGYPGLGRQREEHAELLKKLDVLLEKRKTTADINDFYEDLLDFMGSWLIAHLIYEDKQYTESLNEHGIY